jgi:hypothetical protein
MFWKNFPFVITAFTLLAAYVHYLIFFYGGWTYEWIFVVFYGLFWMLSIGGYLLLNQAIKRSPTRFVPAYLSWVTLKMFLSFGILVAYLVFYRKNIVAVSLNFFLIYLIYLGINTFVFFKRYK